MCEDVCAHLWAPWEGLPDKGVGTILGLGEGSSGRAESPAAGLGVCPPTWQEDSWSLPGTSSLLTFVFAVPPPGGVPVPGHLPDVLSHFLQDSAPLMSPLSTRVSASLPRSVFAFPLLHFRS